MKRTVWFVTGVATGAAGVGYTKRKVTAVAHRLAPANVARGTLAGAKRTATRVAAAVREGRQAAQVKERELRAVRDGRVIHLDEHLQPGDELLVDGAPVETGRVILMRRAEKA